MEEELGIQYDAIQKQAICDAIQNKVFILTGGPGTGKTTVINGIIAVYALLEGLDLEIKVSTDSPCCSNWSCGSSHE